MPSKESGTSGMLLGEDTATVQSLSRAGVKHGASRAPGKAGRRFSKINRLKNTAE